MTTLAIGFRALCRHRPPPERGYFCPIRISRIASIRRACARRSGARDSPRSCARGSTGAHRQGLEGVPLPRWLAFSLHPGPQRHRQRHIHPARRVDSRRGGRPPAGQPQVVERPHRRLATRPDAQPGRGENPGAGIMPCTRVGIKDGGGVICPGMSRRERSGGKLAANPERRCARVPGLRRLARQKNRAVESRVRETPGTELCLSQLAVGAVRLDRVAAKWAAARLPSEKARFRCSAARHPRCGRYPAHFPGIAQEAPRRRTVSLGGGGRMNAYNRFCGIDTAASAPSAVREHEEGRPAGGSISKPRR